MQQNLLVVLKDRQKDEKCLICGENIKPEEELYFSLTHCVVGEVLVHRKHVKVRSLNELQV